MNFRDLSYIISVARFRHFGKAAAHCHVSQPALSSQIKKLESELGVTLFERDNKSVKLTEVGREIINLAEEALNVVERIHLTARTSRDPLAGQLRLGFIPTIAPYLVPHFVSECRTVLPKLDVQFHEDITERLNERLLSGELDVAILATPPENQKLDVLTLYDEPFWVVFPDGHNLHQLKQIKVGDLPPDELLLLNEGHCFRDQALDICNLDQAPDVRTVKATSLETLINMVGAGLGITLVPALAVSGNWISASGLKTEKLKDKKAYRRIYLTYRKTFPRQALLQNLAGILCQNLPQTVRMA